MNHPQQTAGRRRAAYVKLLRTLCLVCAAMTLLTGCGATMSRRKIAAAAAQLAAAGKAGAATAAPYEYRAAQEYLQKAREEHGYATFWSAAQFADKAADLALQAARRAEQALITAPPAP